MYASFPVIADNTITDNLADDGGGLRLYRSFATVQNNLIEGNRAWDDGGGIALYESSPIIEGNTIAGNISSGGAGVYVLASSPTITSNTVRENNASSGGGLLLNESDGLIMNNAIIGNSADNAYGGGGGGLYLYDSSPTIANNTITGNTAGDSGGGLYLRDSSPAIMNTIVAFNSSGICRNTAYPDTPTSLYNCVYGNTAYDYDGLDDPTGTDGNISADPVFVLDPDPGPDGEWGTEDDDYGDAQLLPSSPCVGAGNNYMVPGDVLDLDGDGDTTEPLPFDLAGALRFVDAPYAPDTGFGTPLVDMGAYEHQPVVLGDCDGSEQLELIDFASMADCLDGPGVVVEGECNCADMTLDGKVDLADFAKFQTSFSNP